MKKVGSTNARLGAVLAISSILVVSAILFVGCANSQPAAAAPTKVVATKVPEPTTAAEPTTAVALTNTVTKTSAMTETSAVTETGAATAPIVMMHEDPKLGKILVDGQGMTLYVFDKDQMNKSNCTGDCAKNWPPLTVKDEHDQLTAGEGVTGKLAVVKRDDGAYEVTVNGLPLYHYIKDSKAGDATGQGAGEVWWVVGVDGAKIAAQ